MRAGQLRHTIIIQQVTETNTGGVITNVWSEYDVVRAGIESGAARFAGSEFWAAQQVQDEDVVVFRIRYLSGVTQKMRVLYGYKAYDIKGVQDVKGRGREMIVYTTIAPQEYATFAYASTAGATGDNNGDAVITWTTDFYSSSNVRVRESGETDWVTKTEADTTTRVLSHSFEITGLSASTDYEVQVWGENGAGWSAGWSATLDISLDAGYEVT